MSTTRQAASRLGWVMVGSAVVGELFQCVASSGLGVGWIFLLGFSMGGLVTVLQGSLYRWVTAPERDAPTESNSTVQPNTHD